MATKKHDAVFEQALKDFNDVQSTYRDERLQCVQDRRFYSIAGAQWEGDLYRQFQNRPRFEANKIHLAIIRIFNEYRNNRITVNFVSKEGTEYDKLADVCNGLYRADEQDSSAEEAYDNAFEDAVAGGFGAFRLCTEYEDDEDEENEKQRIKFYPIYDADSSVFFGLEAKRQDKSDAKKAWIINAMSREAYKKEYGDDPASWPKSVHQNEFDWFTPDVVYVAEYYQVEQTSETILVYRTLIGEERRFTQEELDADPEMLAELEATGAQLVKTRKIKKNRVHKYIMSGGGILEDCGFIAGKNIPIVPVYGKRWFIDNVERCMGQVRTSKDSQRLSNMLLTTTAEITAYSPISKPIFTPEQVAGHQMLWANDNVENNPYMLVNPVTDASGQQVPMGAVGYTKAPELPPTVGALWQACEKNLQDLLGNQEAAQVVQPNAPAAAVEMVQGRVDMQAYIYMSNMAKAVKRAGEIWLGMAKEVYVESNRKMKAINEHGKNYQVELGKPVMTESGEIETEVDISKANFDLVVDVGVSSVSKREAATRALTNMLAVTDDPETRQVLLSMIMMNMNGEGVSDVRDYFRNKLVRMGIIKPTPEEAQQLAIEVQNAKPDANTLYLQAAAAEAQSKSKEAESKAVINMAKVEEIKANTMKIMSELTLDEQQQVIDTLATFAKNKQDAKK